MTREELLAGGGKVVTPAKTGFTKSELLQSGGKLVYSPDAAVNEVRKQIEQPEPKHPLDSLLRNHPTLSAVTNAFTSSTQSFADTLGSAASVASGDTKHQDEAHIAEAESRYKLAQQLRSATPEQAAHIRQQLSQGSNVGTATEANPTLMKTNRQVLGEGLGTGLEALSGGAMGGGKTVATKTLGQAALKAGASGGVYGLLSGTSQAMQENQSAGDIVKSGISGGIVGGAIGGSLGAAGHAVSGKFLDKKSEDIYRKVLKMTPTESANEAKQGKNTPALLKKLGLIGSPEEMSGKLTEIFDTKGAKLQNTLTKAAKKGATVSTDEFEKAAQASIDRYKTHVAEFGNIKSRLDTIIANTRQHFGDQIPVDVANEIKSGLWKDSFNRAGSEVVNDATHEAGTAMKELIEKAIPDKKIAAMNKELGQFIVASKQLSKSATRAQTGKMSKFLGAILGGVAGGTVGLGGAIPGMVAGSQLDKVASNPTLRTGIAKILAKAGNRKPSPVLIQEARDFLIRHAEMGAGASMSELGEPRQP